MEKALKPLRFGVPLRFKDRWAGRVSIIEIDDEWQVTNVVIERTFLWSGNSVKLPLSASSGWATDYVSFDCTADEAFGRKIPPLAVPSVAISSRTPLSAPGAHLSGLLIEPVTRQARFLIIRRRGPLAGEMKASVESVSFDAGILKLGAQLEALPHYVDDQDLERAIVEAIRTEPRLTGDDRRNAVVGVTDGNVRLSGNVRSAQAKTWIERAASSVQGIGSIRNEIVDDGALEIRIAQAMARDGFYRKALVYPRSYLGQVVLTGRAASKGVAEDIIRTASKVPGVRDVIDRLEIEGR